MRLRDETPITPEAAAELAAMEAALSGRPVAPEHADLAELALALRDERPLAPEDFTRALDERAAASFPREPAVRRWRGVAARAGKRSAPRRRAAGCPWPVSRPRSWSRRRSRCR